MAKQIDIRISTTADLKGAKEVDQAIARIAQATKQAGGGTSAAPAALKAMGSAAAQAEKDTLRYANALAASQRAAGDAAGAANTYRAALTQLTPGTVEALQATTKLTQAENALAKSSREAAGGAAVLPRTLSGLSHEAADAAKALLATGIAMKAISTGVELIQIGSQAQATRQSFDSLSKSIGTTSDALLGKLRIAAAGTVSDAQLIESANSGILLTSGKLASDLPRLLEIARASAQASGDDIGFVFDSLVKGIARGSPQIIDNAKITLDSAAAFETYAQSIGKSVDQLTREDQQQATLNAVLAAGNDIIAKTGGAAETNAAKIQRLGAAFDNLKASVGGGLADTVLPAADLITTMGQATDGSRESLLRYVDAASAYSGANAQVAQINRDVAGSIADLLGMQSQQPTTNQQVAQSAAATAQAIAQSAAATQAHTQILSDDRAEAVQWQQQYIGVNAAMQDSVVASMADAQAKQAQTTQTQLLEAQTNAAAQAFMLLHPNISASGVAALAAAGQIDPLLAQLIQATLRAREATAALAAFQMQQGLKAQTARQLTGAQGNEAEVRNFKRSVTADALAQQRKAYQDNAKAVAAAKRDQVLAVGTANQQIKQREADLAAAEAQYGKGSAQYIRAETALQQERASAARGRGKAAGAAKLSDQAQLNNQLLANEEKFEQQMQDAAESHVQKLLDIEKDYQEKSLAQQRENEVSKRASRADFYESLTGATKDLGMQQAQEISAEYEAAYQKSQEIAQSGNQKLADDYLKLKQRQLNDEIDYQKQLKKAQKDKDKDEVARLQAVHKLRQDANAEEEKRLMEGGDANQKARQDAIDAENKRYTDQADHIIEQADRAGQAKVDAARRGGKAVDDENAALQHQLDLLNQIKDAAGQIPAPGTGGGEPGTTDTSGGTDTGAAPGESAGGGQSIRAGGAMGLRMGGVSAVGGDTGAGSMEILRAAVALLNELLPQIKAQSRMLSTLRTYQHTLIETTAVFKAIGELRAQLSQPTPAIDPAAIVRMADDTALVTRIMIESIDPDARRQQKVLGQVLASNKTAVDILKTMIDLRNSVANAPGPIDPALIQQLANEITQVVLILSSIVVPMGKSAINHAKQYIDYANDAIGILKSAADLQKTLGEPTPAILPGVMEKLAALAVAATHILEATIVPIGEEQAAAAKRYQETAQAAVQVISDVAELARALKDPVPPIPSGAFERLAGLAALATHIVQTRTIPQTEAQVAAMKRYQETEGAAIAVLKDIADLGRAITEPMPPIPPGTFERLANLAAQATRIVLARAVPLSEEQAAGLKRYQESQGAAVSILKDTAELGKALTEPTPPISAASITRLADEAKRIAQIVLARMVPASEEQDAAAKRYAETTGAAIGVLKDTLELPAKLFTDYRSPSNAQIDQVVADANRIVRRVNQAASVYSTDGLAAAKAFGEATGAVLSSFKEQLLFAQALGSGDFVIDPRNLALFEQGMARTLAVAGRLGAQAAAIPAGNIAALQSAAEALTTSYESLIKLSAVPFGNLPQMTGGLTGVASGGQSVTFNNTFVLPAGTTQQMGQQILGTLQQQLRMRQ